MPFSLLPEVPDAMWNYWPLSSESVRKQSGLFLWQAAAPVDVQTDKSKMPAFLLLLGAALRSDLFTRLDTDEARLFQIRGLIFLRPRAGGNSVLLVGLAFAIGGFIGNSACFLNRCCHEFFGLANDGQNGSERETCDADVVAPVLVPCCRMTTLLSAICSEKGCFHTRLVHVPVGVWGLKLAKKFAKKWQGLNSR